MKSKYLSLSAIILALCFSCERNVSKANDFTKNKISTLKELEQGFVNPPKEYRPTPLWVWNDKMERSQIDFMLTEFKNKGFGGAFVHPRPGLITEYLSDEWFDLFEYSVEKGKELGLNIWIYDENSYPSGFGGGHVPAQMPESYNQGQGLKMVTFNILPDTLSNCFLCLIETGQTIKDITAEMNNFKGQKGKFYVFHKTYYSNSPWFGGFSYVDLLAQGVTQKFIDLTMSGYQKVAKSNFGKNLPGIFSDEPEIHSPEGIRWTPDLFDEFQRKWGYDLKLHLPSLFEETGDWKKIRHNYMETLLQMFIDRWSKPYSNYCKENNLLWTGHYWEHNWPDLSQGSDNMAMYAWHQIPGIDMLFNQFNETSPQAQFGNIRSVKELRSVANQLGYKRTLCETYGGGGWDVTFKDLKRLGDWTYVLGVNFMNQHLSHATLKGARKYDYPPVFTYHSPWWQDYKVLNDYFGRLSVALSNGEQKNNMLIIEPTTTLWNYYSYVKKNETINQIGQTFQNFVTQLEKSQVEYDLGSENIIKDKASIKKGKFVIGQRDYSTVIIPPLMENIEKHTFDLLTDFVKQGGRIITFSVPERINGELDNNVSEFFKSNNPSIILLNRLEKETIQRYFNNPEIKFTDVEGGDLFHQRRKYKDGQLLFLVNSSMEEPTKGMVKVKGKSVIEMDALTGKLKSYSVTAKNGELSFNFNMPPAGSLLLFISNRGIKKYETADEYINAQIIQGKTPVEISPLRENAMKVDFCDLSIKGKDYKNIYFSKAADIVFKEYGFEGNPWNTSIQYKRQIVDRDTFQSEGFTVKYYFEVQGNISHNNMKICVERPEFFKVKINGTKISPISDKWFLDKSFPQYNISQWVKTGKNIVEVEVMPMSVFAEIEPIYILGNFTVLPAKTGWTIDMEKPFLKLGSWKEQGLPFYSWEVAYKKYFTINDIQKSYKISLPKWNGTVCEVVVNGKKAGIIGFEPFELDISDFIKKGENTIEIHVIGSLKNLLGPHFNNPVPGLASPWHWQNVEHDIPSNEYQMIDYGLFEDFKLISYDQQ